MNKNNVIEKYNLLFDQYGLSNESLGWGKKERSNLRFKILIDEWDLGGSKILDWGCGFGELYLYLLKDKIKNFEYTGVDINENLIQAAKERFPSGNCDFEVRDIIKNPYQSNTFDYAFVSGTFNDFRSKKYNFIEKIFSALNLTARKGIAMNFLSNKAEIKYRHASYFNPAKIINLSYKFSNNVILRNDYMPYEFSILINKYDEVDSQLTVYKSYKSYCDNSKEGQ